MFAGVGERTREGNDLYHEMIEGGVIKVRIVFDLETKKGKKRWKINHIGVLFQRFLCFLIYCFLDTF